MISGSCLRMRPQGTGKSVIYITFHLYLVQPFQLIFYRVFYGYDFLFIVVQIGKERIERRCLARGVGQVTNIIP